MREISIWGIVFGLLFGGGLLYVVYLIGDNYCINWEWENLKVKITYISIGIVTVVLCVILSLSWGKSLTRGNYDRSCGACSNNPCVYKYYNMGHESYYCSEHAGHANALYHGRTPDYSTPSKKDNDYNVSRECYICGKTATKKYGSLYYCARHWAMVKTGTEAD